jgi:hypothetical protein
MIAIDSVSVHRVVFPSVRPVDASATFSRSSVNNLTKAFGSGTVRPNFAHISIRIRWKQR